MTTIKRLYVDWADTMFKQLQKKLIRWTTFLTKMLKGIIKIYLKKDVCHLALIIEILMQHFFLKTEP
jgi:hypothetical protein